MKKSFSQSAFFAAALCAAVLFAAPAFAQGYDGLIAAPASPRVNAPAASKKAPADIYSMIQSTAPRTATKGRIGYADRLRENAERRNQEIAEKNAAFKKATEDSFAPARTALAQRIAQNDAQVAQMIQQNRGITAQQPYNSVLAPAPAAPQPAAGGGSSVVAPPMNRQEYQSPY